MILLNEKVWLTLRAFNCEADNDLNDEDGSVQILRVGPRAGGGGRGGNNSLNFGGQNAVELRMEEKKELKRCIHNQLVR